VVAVAVTYEVEQKFPLADRTQIRSKLIALGAVFEESIDQADTYSNHPSRDFGQTDEALRLRQVAQQNWITYKGPKLDQQTKTRLEIELPLPGGIAPLEQFGELLLALGFRRVLTVRKRREPGKLTWEGQEVHVALDHIDTLGDFLELEIAAGEASLPAAKEALAHLSQVLRLPNSERRSYLELLLAATQV
jgi:adenylate cyclase class 2